MATYKVAQLGTGWAVFRIDDSFFGHVDGPHASREKALERQRLLEQREWRQSPHRQDGVRPEG